VPWSRVRRLLVILVVLATSPCRPWPYCSPFPPREQLLAAVVGGAVVVVVAITVLVVVVVAQWRCWVVPVVPFSVVLPRSCCRWCARFLSWPCCSPSPPREQLFAAAVGRRSHVLPTREQWRAAALGSSCSSFPPGGDWGCRHGVSSSLPFVVPLSTLRAGVRSGGVSVSCFVSWRLQCCRRYLPRGYPTSPGSLRPLMQSHIPFAWGGGDGTALVVKKLSGCPVVVKKL
jgi:hypothetical protein